MGKRRSNLAILDLTPVMASKILSAMESKRIRFTRHARDRMNERGISISQALRCLHKGAIVEGPARDTGGEWKVTLSVLTAGTPVNVVAAIESDDDGHYAVVITVYS